MELVRARSLTMGKLGGEVGPWVNFCGLGRLKSDGFTWCSPRRALPWSQATLSEPFLPTPPPGATMPMPVRSIVVPLSRAVFPGVACLGHDCPHCPLRHAQPLTSRFARPQPSLCQFARPPCRASLGRVSFGMPDV
jgi:hypothetical protein